MARVILDVPSEKIKPFINMMVKLGLEKHAISSNHTEMLIEQTKTSPKAKPIQFIGEKFVLFDWEFFSNELEYE